LSFKNLQLQKPACFNELYKAQVCQIYQTATSLEEHYAPSAEEYLLDAKAEK
jgi:hypothetical protein